MNDKALRPLCPNVVQFPTKKLDGASLILASASPRRRDLLGQMGLTFTVLPADADETVPNGITPREAVGLLAVRKAYAALPLLPDKEARPLIIAADTIVDFRGEALGKPLDREDAKQTLLRMSGTRHEVHTGVAVLFGRYLFSSVTTSGVLMRPYDESDIDDYVSTGECMGKAGSYAIQGGGGKLVASYEGALDNIIGLPTRAVAELLDLALENCHEK